MSDGFFVEGVCSWLPAAVVFSCTVHTVITSSRACEAISKFLAERELEQYLHLVFSFLTLYAILSRTQWSRKIFFHKTQVMLAPIRSKKVKSEIPGEIFFFSSFFQISLYICCSFGSSRRHIITFLYEGLDLYRSGERQAL